MARLDAGEREFVSDFGDLAPTPSTAPAPAADVAMQEIDARGISPPLPLLRAHRALRAMVPGQSLKVVTTYPQSMEEFQAMVKYVSGYELVSQDMVGDEFIHVLRRRR